MAITDTGQRVATGVTAVTRSGDRAADHRRLAHLVDEYAAVAVVVGLPLSLSGAVGPAAQAVLDEVGEMRSGVDVEIVTHDERLTTREAAGSLRAAGRRGRRQRDVIDQTAAAVLLQSWLACRVGAEEMDG